MTSKNPEVIGNFEVVEGKLRTRREVLLMGALAATGAIASSAVLGAKADAQTESKAAGVISGAPAGGKSYTAKDFSSLVSKNMTGLSSKQIEQHLKLYEGYVGKINELQAALDTVDISTPTPNATYHPYREMLVEQSFALNGVIYHELYFANLGGTGGEPTGDLKSAVEARWGSNGKFIDHLKAAGKCMRGWVVVAWNTRDNSLQLYGLDAHNLLVPANVIPLVVLDVYEHAYMIDHGINRGAYLDAFMANINWDVCNKRLVRAKQHPGGPETTA